MVLRGKALAAVAAVLAAGLVVAAWAWRAAPLAGARPLPRSAPALDAARAADRPGEDRDWARFNYEVLDAACAGDFDLTTTVRRAAEPTGPAAGRILVHFADRENYLALTVRDRAAELVRVSSGVAVVLARKRAEAEDDAALPPGEEVDFRIKWRAPRLVVLRAGRLLFDVRAPGMAPGRAGVGRPVDGGVEVARPVVQPVAPITVTDDFMRSPGDPSAWSPAGEGWSVRSLEAPARSTNAFVYQCRSRAGSVSLTGRAHWDAYRAAVSVHGPPKGAMGVLFHARDADNGYLLRWTARGYGGEEDAGALTLMRLSDGARTELARRPGGYAPGRWYRLEVLAGEGRAVCRVDGRLAVCYAAPDLWGGRVGLFAQGPQAAEFDDFQVQTHLGTFGSEQEPSSEARCVRGRAPRLFGRAGWDGYAFEASLAFAQSEPRTARLLAAYNDPFDHVVYEVTGTREGVTHHALRRVHGDPDSPELLDEADFGDQGTGASVRARVVLDRGVVTASVDGAGALVAHVGRDAVGPAGLAPGPVAYADPALRPVRAALPVTGASPVFDAEELMAAWSAAAAQWDRANSPDERYDRVYWHKALFFGPTQLEALLPQTARPEVGAELALSVAKPARPRSPYNGYTLRWRPVPPEGADVALLRAGETVARARVPGADRARRVHLRQAGAMLVGYVDGRAVLAWRDPRPLDGERVAFAVRGLAQEPGQVTAFNANLRTYSFNSAPVDWRVGGGVWEVTNRWECDDRWAFWSGMPPGTALRRANALVRSGTAHGRWKADCLRDQVRRLADRHDRHVVLWHKQALHGDQMVEVYMAQMMDRARGEYEEYMRDFNVTICADGRDLSSGYSCVFGGWKDEPPGPRSAIVRAGEVVASQPGAIPYDGHVHHRWVRVRVVKRGGRITFTVHSEYHDVGERELLRLTYEDPDPLQGTRVAVWTYRCPVMVTRARVAADRIGAAEDPFADSTQSVYAQGR